MTTAFVYSLSENHVLIICYSGETFNRPVVSLCLFRVVKEEISDDNAKLPCFNGRVVSWVSYTLYIDLPHLNSPA